MKLLKVLFAKSLAPSLCEYSLEKIMNLIEIPPQGLEVDLAFPCFLLSKVRKNSPAQIAIDIVSHTKSSGEYQIGCAGPYVNITFSAAFVLSQLSQDANYGSIESKTVLIESPSPNTNKPLHLGHVRNMCLGNSLSKIMQSIGHKVVKIEVVNDRGIHICKSMLAYKLWGNNSDPDKKSDHFVGDWYVRYATEEQQDPSIKEQAQNMLRKRESGDKEVRYLRKKMNKRAIDGIQKTYQRYGTQIDDATLESDVYAQGKELAQHGLDTGVFVRDPKENIALPLQTNDNKITYFVVLRSDGTTVYATQDLALIDHRYKKYNMDSMIYIVGNEQDDYFKALFKCFRGLGYDFADQCYHLSYGMIELPNGKMKSRTGNVIDADELIENLHLTSFDEIKRRYPDLDDSVAHDRAEQIALGAINFYMLKIDPAKGFIFDPLESLSFDGETGPYVQYTYARCSALIKKGSQYTQECSVFDIDNLMLYSTEQEKKLALHLLSFVNYLDKAIEEKKPSIICRYIIELCQYINSYYQSHHIIDESQLSQTAHRIEIIRQAQKYLGKSMDLICVPRVEVM